MFSLMKKQFFTLVMMLAIVVLAGTSAMAQDGTLASPLFQINNSAHTFSVTAIAGTSYDWDVFHADNTDASADVTSVSGSTSNTYGHTWGVGATGTYYVQVTQTSATGGCTTVRRVYVTVVKFDVLVYVSDNAGLNLETATPYETCGAGTTANYGDIGTIPAATAFGQTYANTLSSFTGNATYRSHAYVGFKITWDVVAGFTPPAIDHISYVANVTSAPASDFVSIGGVASASNASVTESAGSGTTTFYSTLLYNARWSQDITLSVEAHDVTLYNATNGVIGTEYSVNVTANGTATQNTTDNQIILSAPATSVITVAP